MASSRHNKVRTPDEVAFSAVGYTLLFTFGMMCVLPVVLIIALVFNSVWFNPRTNYVIISGLMWSILAAIHMTFLYFRKSVFLIYLLGVAGQIVIILWSFIKKPRK